MTLGDTFYLALRNLKQAKLRTSLTMLGVSIGIASLTGMVSLGVGLQEQFVSRFTQSGLFDTITVLPGQQNPLAFMAGGRRGRPGGGGRRGGGPETPRPPLNDSAIASLAALADVREVYANIRLPMEAKYDAYTRGVVVAGVPMSARGQSAFQNISYGSFFTDDSRQECLLSLDIAKAIDEEHPGNLIGKTITLSYASTTASGSVETIDVPMMPGGLQLNKATVACPIVGIIEREPGPGMPGGGLSGVMLPQKQAEAINTTIVTGVQSLLRGDGDARTYQSLTVKATKAQATQDVEEKIKALGYNAISLNDALQGAKRAFIVLDIMLSLIGSIALAVSSLGIVNTMVMSILERTREIGVMKAIGGSDADIRKIFLVEASAIGVLGGVVGIVLGWVVQRAINFGANVYIQSQGGPPANLFSLPLWLIGGAIGFSWVVSLIAGSYPARRAARLDPIQALRHD